MAKQHPDYLRNPDTVCDPDCRQSGYVIVDNQSTRPRTMEDHYVDIKELTLSNSVPEKIIVQFETTKNIYLYAWFVYRFYPVARQHSLSVLELALRERFDEELPGEYRGRFEKPALRSLLRYCRDKGILKVENFEAPRRSAESRAYYRTLYEAIEKMESEGVERQDFDDSNITLLEEDWDNEYLDNLVTGLPKIRNAHAHGSTMLDRYAYGTLQIVSEIINQIWLKN